jgi:hypothetical protein
MSSCPNPNPYPKDSIWIGDRYNELRAALILMESTYAEPPPEDPQWIRYFIEKKAINREEIDRSFSRLHWIMTHETVSDSCSSMEL